MKATFLILALCGVIGFTAREQAQGALATPSLARTSPRLAGTNAPPNRPPTISNIPDQTISQGSSTGPISFTIGDPDPQDVAGLLVVASSSNQILVPSGQIVLGGQGTSRTITITPTASQTGSATIQVRVIDPRGLSFTDTFVVTVQPKLPPPQILVQPGPQTVTEGDPVTFSVFATGNPPLAYQWFFNGGIIQGATGASHFIGSAQMGHAGNYTVVVQNAGGSTSSSPAALTVNPRPNQPPIISDIADRTITEGGSTGAISFTVNDPDPQDAAALTVFGTSSDQTLVPNSQVILQGQGATRTVTVTPLPGLTGSTVITVTVVDPHNLSAQDTFVVTVQPQPQPPQITVQPASLTVTDGDAVAFSVLATGDPPLTYQWFRNGNLIPSATASTYSFLGAEAAHAGNYTVSVQSPVGSASSTPAALTVNPIPSRPPTISDIADQTIIAGGGTGAIPFTVGDPDPQDVAGLATAGKSNDQTLVPDAQVVVQGQGTTRTVTVTPLPGRSGTVTITVTVTDPRSLSAQDDFVVTVQPEPRPPRITGEPASLAVAEGTSGTFSVLATGDPPLTYQWFFSGGIIPGATASSYVIERAQLSHAGRYKVVVANLAGTATSQEATLVVQAILYDFGDAPVPYPTLRQADGARHIVVSGFHLGAALDAENDGQPSANADGDDLTLAAADDEDGVTIPGLTIGREAQIELIASREGRVDAWIDFDQDRKWDADQERVLRGVLVPEGRSVHSFVVPSGAMAGPTFARFRLSSKGFLSPEGEASDGEVEDYLVSVAEPPPCTFSNKGTNFWLAFPGNYAPDPAHPVRPSLRVTGDAGTSVRVEVPGIGFATSVTISPATLSATITLPAEAELGTLNDRVTGKGVHVTAPRPVAVFALNKADHTSDGFLALPVSVLGREHVVQAYRNVHAEVPELHGTQFAIVGTETNTTVTIIPSARSGARIESVAYTIHLDEGVAYQFRGTNPAPADLSGSVILADKPIAVFGGHQCANVNSTSILFCDYLVEQLLPTEHWGTEFLTLPLATRSHGDTFRVLAASDGTAVTLVSGDRTQTETLRRGQFWEINLTQAARIRADRPIFVTQYANSSDFDAVVRADPFMITVPPTRTYLNSYMFCTSEGEFAAHYVQIIIPTELRGAVTLDGRAVAADQFLATGVAGYLGATLEVREPGAHLLDAPAPFSALVYGFSEREAYGWPAGFRFGETTPPEVDCLPEYVVPVGNGGEFSNACRAIVPDLRGQVKVSDNCGLPSPLVIVQTPPPGTELNIGAYPLRFTAADAAGNVGVCESVLKVTDPRLIEMRCPTDMIVRCRGTDGAVVTFSATAFNICGEVIALDSVPASGTLFRTGVTEVTCRLNDPVNPRTCTFRVTVECLQLAVSVTSERRPVISWTGSAQLEGATSIGGPWTVIEGAKSPYVVEPRAVGTFFIRDASEAMFLRLRQP